MKKCLYIFSSLFTILLHVVDTNAQQWIRIFDGDTNFMGFRVMESYDKGYLCAGEKGLNPAHSDGWLCKTDINGFRLWDKSFQDSPEKVTFTSLTTFDTGDVTLIGERTFNGYHDPIIIKVNSCGDKQWCKIYDAIDQYGFGYDIVSLPGGGYIALFINWVGPFENKPVWLFRLDEEGEIIWQQYFPQDSIFWGTSVYRILLASDSTVILTGESYTPNPGQTSPSWLRPFIAKVDLDGNAIFELSWGRNDYLVGIASSSIIDVRGSIYTASAHARPSPPYGDSPCLLTTTSFGNEILYKDLKDSTKNAGAGVLAWFQDSTIIFNSVWKGQNPGDSAINGVFKIDTLGNIIIENELFSDDQGFSDCISTFDNKAILIGPFGWNYPYWQTVMIKLNSDLEYDSIYTTPYTYDSLCPNPIVSDTIPLDDCEVIIGINDPIEHPEKTELHVYPNPVKDKIIIEMSKYLIRRTGGQANKRTGGIGISATTIYHQWKEVRLEVFDLFGRLKFSEMIPQSEKTGEVDVDAWSSGMYLVRIVFMNEIVATAKFVVE